MRRAGRRRPPAAVSRRAACGSGGSAEGDGDLFDDVEIIDWIIDLEGGRAQSESVAVKGEPADDCGGVAAAAHVLAAAAPLRVDVDHAHVTRWCKGDGDGSPVSSTYGSASASGGESAASDGGGGAKGTSERRNTMDGWYTRGKPLQLHLRRTIIDRHNMGWSHMHIAREVRVTHGCVAKIVERYRQSGTVAPRKMGGSKPTVLTEPVCAAIHRYKRQNSTISSSSIQQLLLSERVCTGGSLPCKSSINRLKRQIIDDQRRGMLAQQHGSA